MNTSNTNTLALIVHGGAWALPDADVEMALAGCRAAAAAGWEVLARKGSALQAVETTIRLLEDDPNFDAGYGACLNAAGEVELDAIIMDGATLNTGAVAALQRVRHPITLAYRIMSETEHSLLVGAGAEAFARQINCEMCGVEDLLVGKELKRWHSLQQDKDAVKRIFGGDSGANAPSPGAPMGTVGAVARDHCHNIASGTSTGGTPGKLPGRVGDSPLIGCGAYADNLSGGASATGWGETLMKVVISKTVCDLMHAGQPAPKAAYNAIQILEDRVAGLGGLITIDREGNIGAAFNTPRMARAWVTPGGEIHAAS